MQQYNYAHWKILRQDKSGLRWITWLWHCTCEQQTAHVCVRSTDRVPPTLYMYKVSSREQSACFDGSKSTANIELFKTSLIDSQRLLQSATLEWTACKIFSPSPQGSVNTEHGCSPESSVVFCWVLDKLWQVLEVCCEWSGCACTAGGAFGSLSSVFYLLTLLSMTGIRYLWSPDIMSTSMFQCSREWRALKM